jgi:hypothetical protein
MSTKRRKVDAECRAFQDTWTEKYFFIQHFGNPICIICHGSVAVNKEFNIKRHYETKHPKFSKFSGQMSKDEVLKLKLSLEKQSSVFQKGNIESEKNTRASYEVSRLIAENMKPFTDGDFVKKCLIAVVDIVCPEKKTLFSNVSLCKNSYKTNRRNVRGYEQLFKGPLQKFPVLLNSA